MLTDLPAYPPTAPTSPAAAAYPASREDAPSVVADLPMCLKVLWTILLTAVLVNLVVWVSVSAGTGQLPYFWPIWVAGPAGAALFGVSAGAVAIKRSQRASKLHRRREAARRQASNQVRVAGTPKKNKAKS